MIMNIGTVDYSVPVTPPEYKCSKCGATGIKLWRQYQTFTHHINLLCAADAMKAEKKKGVVGDDGKRESELGDRTDQIGGLVPAVPTEEGNTYWGYTSVPLKGVNWWKRLPTRKQTGTDQA
jgi:hypothetical protein